MGFECNVRVFARSHKLLPGDWQLPPPPLPDPPATLEALRRSCARLQMRSVQRRADLKAALAAAAMALPWRNALVQRGARPPSARGACKDRHAQAALDVLALQNDDVSPPSAAAPPRLSRPLGVLNVLLLHRQPAPLTRERPVALQRPLVLQHTLWEVTL